MKLYESPAVLAEVEDAADFPRLDLFSGSFLVFFSSGSKATDGSFLEALEAFGCFRSDL